MQTAKDILNGRMIKERKIDQKERKKERKKKRKKEKRERV